MAISRRGEKRFVGIVAVGENRTTACENFRAAVVNQNMTLLSESKSAFVAVAGVNPENSYSPISGKEATLADDSLVDSLESTSSDSVEHVDVFVSVCTDGCGSVVVSDAQYQPDYCPSCSSALPELDEHETINALSELESDSFDDNLNGDDMSVKGKQGIVVVGDSLEEAQQFFVEASSDESERTYLTDGSAQYVTHASGEADNYSPFNGEASEEDADADELELESNSADEDGEVEAHYLQCLASGCSAHVITTSEHASFCPRCNSGLVDPEVLSSLSGGDDDFEDEDFEEDDLDLDVDIDEDDDFESDSSDDDLDDLDDLEDDLDDFDSDLDDEDFESDSSDEDDLDDLDDLDEDFESFSSDDDDDDDDDLEDDLDDLDDDEDLDDLDDLDDEDDDDFESESSVEVELNFFEAYAGLNEEEHDANLLSLAYCGNIGGEQTWFAFYNGYPVARCLQSNSSAPEMFGNAKFGEATKAAAKSQGVTTALADMGFEMLKPDVDLGVSVSAKLQRNHQAELEAVRSETANAINEVQERFQAALATSGMALNRNVVRGKTNPLADTLIASLSAAGVGNAAELVQTAFEQRSDAYVSELVGLASEQVSKPLESQNDFANMVSQASFLTSNSSSQGVEIGRSVSSNKTEENLISESSEENPENTFESRSASLLSGL